MIKKNSTIRGRIIRTVLELVTGTLLSILLFFIFTYLLVFTGQLNVYDSKIEISVSDTSNLSDVVQAMNNSIFDYVVFNRKTGTIEAGNYQKKDLPAYREVFAKNESVSNSEVYYVYYANSEIVLTVRQPMIPEFVNPNLRHISFNLFSYLFFFVFETILLIWSLTRLIKEFSKNFLLIQKKALNMGQLTFKDENIPAQIQEFDEILSVLYQKDDELTNLLKSERREKEDLSFQVGALAHDVKTPLTVLKGNLELLELTNLTVQQKEYTQSMNNSIVIFERYFSSMIDYSRLLIEDKDYGEQIHLPEFLSELSVEAKSVMDNEMVDFKIINTTKLMFFKGNRFNLNRALINILANAARYSSGEKKVTLTIIEETEYINFVVWNNGLPFTEQSLLNADKLFYTENKGRNNKHYGLGLAFAKQVATRHLGELFLSNPDRGGAQVTLLIKK